MKYTQFEALVSGIGAAAIIGSLALSSQGAPVFEEVIAQLLLVLVLISAVHYGRRGGFIAALIASLIYIVLRIPLVMDSGGLTPDIVVLLLVRVLSYGLVGIAGGELCSRIRYIFASLEDSSSVDEWSQVFNQRFITRAFDSVSGQFSRYQTPYSVVVIGLSDAMFSDLRASKQRSIVRGVATHIRNDIRLVDEAGRLEDGRFLIVLPHTPKDGAQLVGERLHHGICNVLGARDDSVDALVLGAPEDAQELAALRQSLVESTEISQVALSST